MMGDFNDIMSQHEQKGGNPFVSSSTHNLSSDLNNLGLMGFQGYPYTWSNKRIGTNNIQQRLDRGIGNPDWLFFFPHASILHLPAIFSDHSAILLTTSTDIPTPKPFRFKDFNLMPPLVLILCTGGGAYMSMAFLLISSILRLKM